MYPKAFVYVTSGLAYSFSENIFDASNYYCLKSRIILYFVVQISIGTFPILITVKPYTIISFHPTLESHAPLF